MPWFGPEPKFEPEPGRTEPRSSLKVQVSGQTGLMVQFGVQRMTVFHRNILIPSELNLIKVPKYLFEYLCHLPFLSKIACDFIDQFLVSCV